MPLGYFRPKPVSKSRSRRKAKDRQVGWKDEAYHRWKEERGDDERDD